MSWAMLPTAAPTHGASDLRSIARRIAGPGDHLIQHKMDGVRARMAWDGQTLTITARSGADWSTRFPELRKGLDDMPPFVFDTELLAASFALIQSRAATVVPVNVEAGYVTAHVFDVLRWGNQDLMGDPLAVRLHTLTEGVARTLPLRYETSHPYTVSALDDIWSSAKEGIVLKRANSLYVPGRTSAWVKVKKVQTTTCIATSHERGEGGGLVVHLALIDGGTVRYVGKVGSGFSSPRALAIMNRIDRGDMPLVEVEHLGTTGGNLLRQPTFKGWRHDATITDATFDQLEIP